VKHDKPAVSSRSTCALSFRDSVTVAPLRNGGALLARRR